jgi:hypothetical protein
MARNDISGVLSTREDTSSMKSFKSTGTQRLRGDCDKAFAEARASAEADHH